jgi:hypothetical protein
MKRLAKDMVTPFWQSKPPIYLGRARRESLHAQAPHRAGDGLVSGHRVNLLERYDYPLQVCAQACEGPVFLFRPAAAQHEASAASLRVMATFALDWEIQVHVLKRRGPTHEGLVRLRSVPGGLEAVLTPRLQMPSRLIATREGAPRDGTHHTPARPTLSEGAARPVVHEAAVHALGGATPSARARRRATVR